MLVYKQVLKVKRTGKYHIPLWNLLVSVIKLSSLSRSEGKRVNYTLFHSQASWTYAILNPNNEFLVFHITLNYKNMTMNKSPGFLAHFTGPTKTSFSSPSAGQFPAL